MPDGGVVHVDVAREGDEVVVRIADEGAGVPAEVRERMFDAFYSTKERGTGLGLPLTQQILIAHRGAIRCEDRPGGGACFVLTLPVAAPAPAQSSSAQSSPAQGSSAQGSPAQGSSAQGSSAQGSPAQSSP
jgi:signal transduction histidine kinase